jgi:hypothetical protein
MSQEGARRVARTRLSPAVVEEHGTKLTSLDPVTIDGTRYEMSLRFVQGKLETILLSFSKHQSDSNCRDQYRRTFSLIQSKYGPPDQQPIDENIGGLTRRNADFTFRDGNSITVFSMFANTFCVANVVYRAKKDGGSF